MYVSEPEKEFLMQHHCAPLEGLTDSIYRQTHHKYFGGVDCYYMAFLSPTMHHSLTAREKRDLPPADSVPFRAIPQILTKSPEDFLWAGQVCRDLGYEEVNLNLGCPSGTVVSKNKGAGMLRDPEALHGFLEEIFSASSVKISVKTRLGLEDPEEFPEILEVLNRFPLESLTIHPRVQKQFYKGTVFMESFRWAAEHCTCPVIYNGDLCTQARIQEIETAFPKLQGLMAGRGLIGNPALFDRGLPDRKTLSQFHQELLEGYRSAFGSDRNAMFRLKEAWQYLLCLFEDGQKLGKELRKTTSFDRYLEITRRILEELPMREELEPSWIS